MKFHNFHFYWLDISLSQDIKAVHIIPKENILSCRPLKFFKTQNYTSDQISQAIKMMNNFNNLLIKVKIMSKNIMQKNILKFLMILLNKPAQLNMMIHMMLLIY